MGGRREGGGREREEKRFFSFPLLPFVSVFRPLRVLNFFTFYRL